MANKIIDLQRLTLYDTQIKALLDGLQTDVDGKASHTIGTSSSWTYIKDADGTAVCWGEFSSSYGTGAAWAGGYYHKRTATLAFPSGLFTKAPGVIIKPQSTVLHMSCGNVITNTGMTDYVFTGSAAAISGTHTDFIMAVGKWK